MEQRILVEYTDAISIEYEKEQIIETVIRGSQMNADNTTIFYGPISQYGSCKLYDNDEAVLNYILDGIISSNMLVKVSVIIDGSIIGLYEARLIYSFVKKHISLEFTDSIRRWTNLLFTGYTFLQHFDTLPVNLLKLDVTGWTNIGGGRYTKNVSGVGVTYNTGTGLIEVNGLSTASNNIISMNFGTGHSGSYTISCVYVSGTHDNSYGLSIGNPAGNWVATLNGKSNQSTTATINPANTLNVTWSFPSGTMFASLKVYVQLEKSPIQTSYKVPDASLGNITLLQLYNELKTETEKYNESFASLPEELTERFGTVTIDLPNLEAGTLFDAWCRFCELALCCIYKDRLGMVALSYYG